MRRWARRPMQRQGDATARLVDDLDLRRLPGTVQDGLLAPVRADVERELAFGRRQPVAFPVLARRLGAGVEGQRSVAVALQPLVLCAQREALEVVGVEEVVLVVERQRPEAADWRLLAGTKCDRIGIRSVELRT